MIFINNVLLAFLMAVMTWLITSLGSAAVIFFRSVKDSLLDKIVGFSAGVMLAASFWSLLQPAVERAEASLETPAWLVATVGFLCGSGFIWISDKIISKRQKSIGNSNEKSKIKRVLMLVVSITLHNIPEGLAIGVAFGALNSDSSNEALMAAYSVAIGIGIQNFPEGAAISLPLRREGYSRAKSFFWGQLSAIVEPVSAALGAFAVVHITNLLPYALAFAAGAMILVCVHELIPESQNKRGNGSYNATMGIIGGFAVMMLLDVMLK